MSYKAARAIIGAVSLMIAAPVLTTQAHAIVPTSTSAVNTDTANLALRGHDPVAYFSAGKPTLGEARYSAKFNGATYHFASAANLKMFKASPAAYAPQYGGFCAMGVALEKKLDGDPMVWKIVDKKLYLNVNPDVFTAWSRDIPGNLVKAEENWPEIKNKTPDSL
jgi:YHS domain-containing protein